MLGHKRHRFKHLGGSPYHTQINSIPDIRTRRLIQD